jgi:hypothetical protein
LGKTTNTRSGWAKDLPYRRTRWKSVDLDKRNLRFKFHPKNISLHAVKGTIQNISICELSVNFSQPGDISKGVNYSSLPFLHDCSWIPSIAAGLLLDGASAPVDHQQ